MAWLDCPYCFFAVVFAEYWELRADRPLFAMSSLGSSGVICLTCEPLVSVRIVLE